MEDGKSVVKSFEPLENDPAMRAVYREVLDGDVESPYRPSARSFSVFLPLPKYASNKRSPILLPRFFCGKDVQPAHFEWSIGGLILTESHLWFIPIGTK
jgi:hypothetical protein